MYYISFSKTEPKNGKTQNYENWSKIGPVNFAKKITVLSTRLGLWRGPKAPILRAGHSEQQ